MDWRDFLALALLLGLSVAFKVIFERSLPFLVNHRIFESVDSYLRANPLALLWPQELETGRYHWVPTSLLPFYALSLYFSTFSIYLILSSMTAVAGYLLSRFAGRSRVFAVTLTTAMLFGTQLIYASTLGLTLLHYIVLGYIFINIYTIHICISNNGSNESLLWFVISIVVLALATEIWINYAIGLILCCLYLFIWSGIHRHENFRRLSFKLGAITLVLLLIYLPIRMSVAGQYMGPGAEEELILTYGSFLLMVEDFVTNFFTFLYMSVSNFFPSFLTSSNSLTVLGPERIIAEQNGYHQQYQQLVVMNHLFFWRYFAGITATIFFASGYTTFRRSLESRSTVYPTVICGMLIIVTGFCTYLLIKFRPYNSAPALHYKTIISICGVALLLSFLLEHLQAKFASRRIYWAIVCSVWAVLVTGAITRPGMIRVQLQNVGLQGYSDPWKIIKSNLGLSVWPAD
ncbi:hypothetical protein [Microvirga puerhi]|uniref:Glycosyltransferase RgtA/B/C/D-like domain-containing protein n=1 Tax=Microvirga puerhi TaxID=2876078 RepID=A0ABS7VL41_9HYPH|nr:hypothetical protein [Microvirga puerhi]MBZ6076249.1 hypothetical protein [Microvirga puerhi]